MDENALYSTFANTLSDTPLLCLSSFGEENSWSRDLLTLGHNAVRNELSDMFVMYRSMADIGEYLTHGDVKASTLWFRAFYKFTTQNVLSWQKEEMFPQICSAVTLDKKEERQMLSLDSQRDQAMELLQILYAKQARLSAELSRDAKQESVRLKFVEIVCDVVHLAFKLIEYFKATETFLLPLLDSSGLVKQDRDEFFKKMSLRIQEVGTEQIDIPMLITWMPRSRLRQWLTACAVDHRNKPIPLWMYNDWQTNHYHERHRKLVEDLVAKSKCV